MTMNTDFKIKPIGRDELSELLSLSTQELVPLKAKWIIADESPGYPCRVSLIYLCSSFLFYFLAQ